MIYVMCYYLFIMLLGICVWAFFNDTLIIIYVLNVTFMFTVFDCMCCFSELFFANDMCIRLVSLCVYIFGRIRICCVQIKSVSS